MIRFFAVSLLLSPAFSFTIPSDNGPSRSTKLNSGATDDELSALEKIRLILQAEDYPPENPEFDEIVKKSFPYAISYKDLENKVVDTLSKKGFTRDNTLLATSLSCDELARRLENVFVKVYGNNYNLGGLSGFPFAGSTGFSTMAEHIPDDGYCFILYGPQVGITQDGVIGMVEREGIAKVGNCCGSAIAASKYLEEITTGEATITTSIQSFTDYQQGAVQELMLPHFKRLMDADERMLELPYALYESQDLLMREIVKGGAGGLKKGTAIIGGVQISTSPDTMDYFHPLRFDYLGEDGEFVDDLLPTFL